jgi:DNA helicase-2/ATP-dependent DNA helicase PcrA
MTPTDEQSDILLAATTTPNNLMINALAGTGKSATLKLIDQAIKAKPALYLVFAKRNQTEAQDSKAFRDTTTIKTFNSLGLGIWRDAIASPIKLDKYKPTTLFKELLEDMPKGESRECWKSYHCVMDGVKKAKSLGYVPTDVKFTHKSLITHHELHRAMDETPDDLAADLIDNILSLSIQRAYKGSIDFDDQIYMPALFGGAYPKFPLILVDEYQDQSPVNHAMLARLVKGRIIGVGDPWQNIYGFRGAKAGGMSTAVDQYSMTELPLSVSFRCPRALVEHAQWRVPHFRWSKEGGHVRTCEVFDPCDFSDDVTIICRNNAPLLRLAFRLISSGRSVNVFGSELGPRLVGILKKLGPEGMSQTKLLGEIEQWRQEKVLAQSKSANDLADCMRVFAEHGDSLGQAISYAEHIFKQEGTIRLLTGHKSKGLEFNDVIFLDPWLVSETEQDMNLRYVIQTRSQNSLMMLDSDTVSW